MPYSAWMDTVISPWFVGSSPGLMMDAQGRGLIMCQECPDPCGQVLPCTTHCPNGEVADVWEFDLGVDFTFDCSPACTTTIGGVGTGIDQIQHVFYNPPQEGTPLFTCEFIGGEDPCIPGLPRTFPGFTMLIKYNSVAQTYTRMELYMNCNGTAARTWRSDIGTVKPVNCLGTNTLNEILGRTPATIAIYPR